VFCKPGKDICGDGSNQSDVMIPNTICLCLWVLGAGFLICYDFRAFLSVWLGLFVATAEIGQEVINTNVENSFKGCKQK